MSTVRLLAVVAMLALSSGCATLNEAQCGSGDWFGIGESDALGGHTPDRIVQHDKACAKFGLAPDPNGYNAGYAQGLVGFCVPAEAFALGRRGASYYRQCPPEAERDFIPAYELGSDVYAIDQELIRIDIEIDDLRDDIKDEKTSPESREGLEQRLDYVKDDRDRRSYERSALIDRARQRGYGDVW
jgi:hypothetical protein